MLAPQAKIYVCHNLNKYHFVKIVHIRSYSGPHFPVFGLNTERYFVILKMRIRITPNTDTFHAVYTSQISLLRGKNTSRFLSHFASCFPACAVLTVNSNFGNVAWNSGYFRKVYRITGRWSILELNVQHPNILEFYYFQNLYFCSDICISRSFSIVHFLCEILMLQFQEYQKLWSGIWAGDFFTLCYLYPSRFLSFSL